MFRDFHSRLEETSLKLKCLSFTKNLKCLSLGTNLCLTTGPKGSGLGNREITNLQHKDVDIGFSIE